MANPAPDEGKEAKPAVPSGEGPFEFREGQGGIANWTYALKPGKTASANETAFAYRCSRLSGRIRHFGRRPEYDDYHRRIIDSFSDGVVRQSSADTLDALDRQVADVEKDFIAEFAIQNYRKRVGRTLAIGFLVLFALLSAIVYSYFDLNILEEREKLVPSALGQLLFVGYTYYFVILGVVLGRIIALFLDYGAVIDSFDGFFEKSCVVSSPILDVLVDVLIGVVACLVFTTGAIVISVGGDLPGSTPVTDGQALSGGLSTLEPDPKRVERHQGFMILSGCEARRKHACLGLMPPGAIMRVGRPAMQPI